MNTKTEETLRQYGLAIKKAIDDGLSSGSLRPELTAYQRWKVNKYQYTDKGITESSASGVEYTKETWLLASSEMQRSLDKFPEYGAALENLNTYSTTRDHLENDLQSFGRRVINHYFDNQKTDETFIDSLIIIFLKNMRGERVKYGATIELAGVILRPEYINISDDIIIRKPQISDLEKERYNFVTEHISFATAILNIEFLGLQANEVQKKVEQAIAILRLFDVGGVKYLSYSLFSESVTDQMASIQLRSGDMLVPLETYLIKSEDDAKLKNFWLKVSDSMPKSFYDSDSSKIDHTTIAYNRYADALLHNGILERRIANSIMGLEALLFKADGETQELSYRLRMRLGKLLNLLGLNPTDINTRLKDAYWIRSTFTHGGHLDYKKKRKLETKYGDPKNLLLSILDYLRISIIVYLFINKEKR